MADKKKVIPEFTNEEQEAEFWETHSPLDYEPVQRPRRVKAKMPKDRPITIRLDSDSRKRLQEMAEVYHLGSSTLARLVITAAIDQWVRRKQIGMTIDDAVAGILHTLPPNLQAEAENIFEEALVGTPDRPAFFVLKLSDFEFFARKLFPHLMVRLGVKTVYPEDEVYEFLKEKMQASVK